MNNPISQIERTKDAYAGNMQGLQKRANVSKELIDLLAMQQLKKDLDAAKRNQMMQMQGNPATIKDQLQQGLMGEYRQQAAKEMGMMPSEGQAMARAQQAMPQGMPQQQMAQRPQMPQGAPQQPQMAQGVMSQARPVQLAGGGIVAFNKGGPTEDELVEFIKAEAEKRRASEVASPSSLEQTPRQRAMQEQIARLAERRGDPFIDLSSTKSEIVERKRKEALQSQMEEMFTPETGGIQVGQMPRPEPIVDEDARYAEEQRLMGEMSQREVDAETAERARLADGATNEGIAGVAQTPAKTGGEGEELGVRELLMKKLRRDIDRDPEAAGAARAKMIRKELGLDEGLAALDERKARRKQLLEDMEVTGMDRFQELLGAASIGGTRGVGIRGNQLRQESRNRRMAYENKLDEIENTSMELRRSIGTTAASEYSKAAKRSLDTINSAATVLQRMDVEDRQRFEAGLTRKRQDAKLEIDRTDALGKLLGSTQDYSRTVTNLQEAASQIETTVRERYAERVSLLERRALGGDEQAKTDLATLRAKIALEITEDPNYVYIMELQEAVKKEGEASRTQRAALAEGLKGVQVADVSDEDESLVASYEGR